MPVMSQRWLATGARTIEPIKSDAWCVSRPEERRGLLGEEGRRCHVDGGYRKGIGSLSCFDFFSERAEGGPDERAETPSEYGDEQGDEMTV